MSTNILTKISERIVLWQRCWDPEVCAPWPISKCYGAHICIRLIEDGTSLILEAELNGHSTSFNLLNGCIPTFSVGVFSLEVCVGDININKGSLVSLNLTVKLCANLVVINPCITLFEQAINIGYLTADEVAELESLNPSHKTALLAANSGRTKFPVSASFKSGKTCNC